LKALQSVLSATMPGCNAAQHFDNQYIKALFHPKLRFYSIL
jgi:hypothetical protein